MEAQVQAADGTQTPSSAYFQELRPVCVEISKLAIREADSPEAARKLTQLTQRLHEVLAKAGSANALNPKLAEYVFFPLSHIFRQIDVFPHILVENCLKCLQVLIQYGWRTDLSGELARQLLSLAVVVVDGKPGAEEKKEIPEETMLEGLRTMSALFAGSSFRVGPSLTQDDFLPTTGHAVSVVLETLEGAPYAEVQKEAAEVIQRLFGIVKSQEAFEALLPGTVSAMVKLLSTPTKYKSAVLGAALCALDQVLKVTLGDMRVEQAKWNMASRRSSGVKESDEEASFGKWMKATAGQVKLALAPVARLHKNESPMVRQKLYESCISLLDECHSGLRDCAPLLLETALILSDEQSTSPTTLPSLNDLISIHPELGEILKNTVYSWMTSLPRQMQANDERVKCAAFTNLSRGIEMLKRARIESSTLEDALSDSITDSMVVLLNQSRPSGVSHSGQVQLLADENNEVSDLTTANGPYQKALIEGDNTGGLREAIVTYLGTLSTMSQRSRVAEMLLQNLQGANPNIQVSSLWLSFELCKASEARNADVDAMLKFDDDNEDDAMLGELYSFSVDTLGAHTDLDAGDWRLDLITMEIVAHAAAKAGADFRPELIDVLFPIATFLGSDKEHLRQQAIATLNSLAMSCQYGSVSELLIANVDYVVNSVSLRLNSLDISPASIAVLTMMVRLAGPKLVPFLDDVADSIFAALENYHGYTSFVENLFSVLIEIVGAAVKTDTKLLTGTGASAPMHRKERKRPAGLKGVLDHLAGSKKRRTDDVVEEETGKRPEGPFTRFVQEEPEDEAADSNTTGQEVEKPANPPTYQLLLRIASLTQHYLTSPSPKLRRSLLEVLSIAAPALGADEDAFLPLVNAVWPVVWEVTRHDNEGYVVIEACRALSSLCAAAGDFLSSRFKTVWPDSLFGCMWHMKSNAAKHTKRGGAVPRKSTGNSILMPYQTPAPTAAAVAEKPDDGGLGQHASEAKLWEAGVGLLVAMVTYVRLDDEVFDDILGLLSEEIEWNEEARAALNVINPDAVWLVRFNAGRIDVGNPPPGEGLGFADVKRLSPQAVM